MPNLARPPQAHRPRILFVAEDITLAQVVRLITLAQGLDPQSYEVHFACRAFDPFLFMGTTFRQWPLFTLPTRKILGAMDRGRRLYELGPILRYVAAEKELFAQVKPDLVIGDMRLSLCVSAPLAGIPYAFLINAYWSPFTARVGFPMPDHPLIRVFGEKLAGQYFPKALPAFFRYFARPFNRARMRFGLPPLGGLIEVLTAGDFVLYPDVPSLTPLCDAPANHHFLGPVLWSPTVDLPDWWDALDGSRPTLYLTLGSSGNASRLPILVKALRELPVNVMLATAGRFKKTISAPNFFVANFLPGHLAARRSALVLSNGGSSTGYQALAEGVPVLGVPSNFDQYLAMDAIQKAGAGLLLRAGGLSVRQVQAAVDRLLREDSFHKEAGRLRSLFGDFDPHSRFARFLRQNLA